MAIKLPCLRLLLSLVNKLLAPLPPESLITKPILSLLLVSLIIRLILPLPSLGKMNFLPARGILQTNYMTGNTISNPGREEVVTKISRSIS
jgi:hypothetical protein